MGNNFMFTEWSNQWLTSSGVNTLIPVIDYNNDNSLRNIRIKQKIDPFGDNRLRKSKIDIGIYDNDYKLHVLKDVVISEKLNMTIVEDQ